MVAGGLSCRLASSRGRVGHDRGRLSERSAGDRRHRDALPGDLITLIAQNHGRVVGIADVDRNVREQARASFGSTPLIFEDYRQLLDRKDVDVILIGAPTIGMPNDESMPAGRGRMFTSRSRSR